MEIQIEDDDNWSDEELRAALLAYRVMQSTPLDQLNKSAVYRKLSVTYPRRVPNAWERRMSNISALYATLGREWLLGLKPLANIGTNVIVRLERILSEIENRPQDEEIRFKSEVLKELAKTYSAPATPMPTGENQPPRVQLNVTGFVRDIKVISWVIKHSNGFCELCDRPAPFTRLGGVPFLEVHHVIHLSDNGPDTVSNAVALCPNCHRELHYGLNASEKKEFLYGKVKRLER